MSTNGISASAIMYTASLAGLQDGSGELATNQDRVRTNTVERAAKHDELEKLMKEAERLQQEAKELAEKANDAGKFSKAGAVEDAGNARMKAEEANAELQRIQTEIEEKGKAAEDALERLQAVLKTLDTIVQDFQAAENGEGELAEAGQPR